MSERSAAHAQSKDRYRMATVGRIRGPSTPRSFAPLVSAPHKMTRNYLRVGASAGTEWFATVAGGKLRNCFARS
jgi:hypothetical protein